METEMNATIIFSTITAALLAASTASFAESWPKRSL
jgi:hypothetical protein